MKVGLVLEGGAMRGMYTAGVLDILMENNINIDAIIGVSAGALFGANYLSNQKGRVIRYSKRFCKNHRYMGILSYILTGNIINKNFAFYKVNRKLDPFDEKTFKNSHKDFYAVATNVETGTAKYFKIRGLEDLEKFRASAAIPLVSKMVEVDNKKYLDGGVSDSIPVDKAIQLGFDKIIVVLTQPYDYRKKELNSKTIKKINRKYKKYPKFIKTMINRPHIYNETLEKIIEKENNKEIFVIRPSKKLDIKVIERDENKLQSVYDIGVKDAKKNLNKIKDFIKDNSK